MQHLSLSIESGQFHHWEKSGEVYAVVNGENAFFLKGDRCLLGDEAAFLDFFDRDGHYDEIKEKLLMSKDMKDLARYTSLRLLKQDPWEAIVGFILSANNHLTRIRRSVLDISKAYGKCIASFEDLKAYALPTPQEMARLNPEDLRALGTGYRDQYLIKTARGIAEGCFDLKKADHLDYTAAKKYVMTLPGVGSKVADCILLFGYGKGEAFPVDTWIAKAMERFGDFPSKQAMCDYGMARFKEDAGYIQQLLFVSEREKR